MTIMKTSFMSKTRKILINNNKMKTRPVSLRNKSQTKTKAKMTSKLANSKLRFTVETNLNSKTSHKASIQPLQKDLKTDRDSLRFLLNYEMINPISINIMIQIVNNNYKYG